MKIFIKRFKYKIKNVLQYIKFYVKHHKKLIENFKEMWTYANRTFDYKIIKK